MRVALQLARSAVGVILLTFGGTAWGQGVIHVVPPSPIFYAPFDISQDIDINQDGIADFNLFGGGIQANFNPLGNNGVIVMPSPPPDSGSWLAPFTEGYSISSSLDPMYTWHHQGDGIASAAISACVDFGCYGLFLNQTAFAGLELDIGGSKYYGWVRIQNYGINAGQILDWAYHTSPDTPILAGAVPEPATCALVAVGGLAFWLFRRRVVPLR